MPGRFDQANDVFDDGVIEAYGLADGAHAQHVVAGKHVMHGGSAVGDVDLTQNVDAHLMAWVADGGLDEESVHLRFGQLIGAELFDRILRGDHHERLRYGMGHAIDGDLLLLHDLEQCGLRFR